MANEIIKGILENGIDAKMVYHYTDLRALEGIFKNKSLYLSHITTLSGDKEEFNFGVDYIINRLLRSPLNKEHEGLLNTFGESLKAGKDDKGVSICVCSFCEKIDLKSQWEKFGNVAIAFETEDLQRICDNKDFTFGKIIYEDRLRDQCIINLIKQEKEDLQVSQDWFELLEIYIAESVCFFKRKEKYHDEYEVRIVTNPSVSMNKRIREKDGLEIRYYPLPITDEKGALLKLEIFVGLDANQKQSYDKVNSILKEYSISNCKVSCIS